MIIDIPGVTERRQSPRYALDLVLDLVLENASMATVNTRNISSCGLQIICDTWVTDTIEPRGIQNHSISHIRLKVIAELPIVNKDDASKNKNTVKKLYANCRIMSVRRMSQDTYMLNLAFISFENGSESVLDEFLDQHVQKKTVINVSA
ncbi:MAG: hypothetical protein RQ982_12525 [Gammaproteobacteria bacterium]|nr:hypothetical protein [Gammaproteobacteria bacterium]